MLVAPGVVIAGLPSASVKKSHARELTADLVIIGGGLGGCAAALAAARNGLRVIMGVIRITRWLRIFAGKSSCEYR